MNARLRLSPRLIVSLLLPVVVCAANPAGPSAEVPCKVHQKTAAVYPVSMLHQGVIRGQVQLVAEIDPTGKLGDVLVSAYTNRTFADAALTALKEWSFDPGMVEGRPITSILTIDFEFETTGIVAHEVTFDSRSLDRIGQTFAYRPHGIETLDRRPGRPRGEEPVYPKAWIQEGRAGSVLVEFFIDETGQARLPSVAEGDDRWLASSALSAVRSWRFDPPTYKGKPVLVRAAQRFVFELPATDTAAPKRG